MTETEIEDLMRASLAGDQIAYRKCLAALADLLRRMAVAMLPPSGRHLAEDVVQETLLVVHLKRASWDQSRPLMAWLRVILRHKMIDALRRSGAAHMPIDDFNETLPAPCGADPLDARFVEQVIDKLPSRDAALVRAYGLRGRDEADLRAEFGLTSGALRVALHRALKRVSDLARKEGSL